MLNNKLIILLVKLLRPLGIYVTTVKDYCAFKTRITELKANNILLEERIVALKEEIKAQAQAFSLSVSNSKSDTHTACKALKDLISGVNRLGPRIPALIEVERAKMIIEKYE